MSEVEAKPLNWSAGSNIGYTVERRSDGGMNITFSSLDLETLDHWRDFALSHLIDSDRLTRNLYDLRNVETLTDDAIQYALEVNNDPSVRNIRLAVVVSNEKVFKGVLEVQALTSPGGVEMGIFTSMEEAEAWLKRPLTYLV